MYIIMALTVIKFLTETIQAMAMGKNIALLAAGHRSYVTYHSTPQLFSPLFLISGPDLTRPGI